MLAAGCAQTPDLSPWAEQTANIQSTVAEEHSAISSKFVHVSSLYAASSDPLDQQLANGVDRDKKNFNTAAKKIDGTLTVMVVYSNSIANLAKAGHSGAEAIDGIAESINNAALAIDESLSLVDSSSKVFQTVSILADAYTQARSQESLAKAMAHAQPAIESIGNELKSAYGEKGAIFTVNSGLSGAEESMLIDNALPNASEMYQTAIANCSDVQNNSSCDIEKVTKLKAAQDSYVNSLSAIEAWKSERAARANAVVAALDAWMNEHRRVANYLERCGGLRFVAFECEGLDVSRLAALINIARSN